MPERLAFTHGTLLTDAGEVRDALVLVEGGRIAYAGPWTAPPAEATVVDATGLYIAPGLIDIHIHGGDGSDFMDATPEDVDRIFVYHARHGVTALCPTTATAPHAEILACLDSINAYRSRGNRYGRALGAHIEGPYLCQTKRGCHLPDYVRNPVEAEWSELLERGPLATMTLAPELPGARPLIEALRRRGAIPSIGHSEALYHEIVEALDWGAAHATHLYCAMTDAMNNRWRGTPNPRTAGIVEAVYLEERLSSELITDGKHLSKEMMILALRNKGYDKLAIISDAMRGAGMPDGEYTFGPRHGMVAVVKNREARIPDGTALASSVYAMDEMVRVFRDATGVPLWQAVRMASLTPAEILGVDDELGSLRPGKAADVILLDEGCRVHGTWIAGGRIH
ncbi:MAG: N-acetylglucosamine-6-phosphate deacetylase [Acidobacteriaceae bacterium]|nr:N-acetylglucosamine-6-phosphate deacetylase [Acidobacteriaceae bacterium]